MIRSARHAATAMIALSLFGCSAAADGDDALNEETDSVSEALTSDISVYADAALASPWQSWSWSTTVSTASTDAPLVTGSKSQIKTTLTADWGALSIARTGGELSLDGYDTYTFNVRGATAGKIWVYQESVAGGATAKTQIDVTTSWTTQTIKLPATVGTSKTFAKLNFMGEKKGQTFYVDNVTVKAKNVVSQVLSATFPKNALAPVIDNVVGLVAGTVPYYVYVPSTYDITHKTPMSVLIWLHGCGGQGEGDTWTMSPGKRVPVLGTQNWITLSLGGRDGKCWNVNTDSAWVLSALADLKTHFNVDPKRVVIGGYSSGGDLAYRTAFYNSSVFAGVIAENTSPFRDTGSTQSVSLAQATTKFPVAHLAHLSDTTYPIARVRTETDALTANGFPMTRIERPGTHSDPDTATSGTTYDRRMYLLPFMNVGWATK